MQWFVDNWPLILSVLVVLVNLINALTPHFSNFAGFKKFALVFTEIVSLLASKDSSKVVKLPGKTN